MRMENEKQNKQQVLKLREHISSMEQKVQLSSKVNPAKYISFQFLKTYLCPPVCRLVFHLLWFNRSRRIFACIQPVKNLEKNCLKPWINLISHVILNWPMRHEEKWWKELSLFHKLWFSNPYILATRFRRPSILQTMQFLLYIEL